MARAAASSSRRRGSLRSCKIPQRINGAGILHLRYILSLSHNMHILYITLLLTIPGKKGHIKIMVHTL